MTGSKKDINILILGHSEHGKSKFAERIVEHFNWSQGESSYVCKEIVYPVLLKLGFDYNSPEDAWLARRKNKPLWKAIIKDYNKDDLARLTKQIFKDNELYVGQRDGEEFVCAFMQGCFDLIIYVDASKRLPDFDPENLDIPVGMSDIVIDNNGTLEEFNGKIDETIGFLTALMFLKSHLTKKDNRTTKNLVSDLLRLFKNIQKPTLPDTIYAVDWYQEMLNEISNIDQKSSVKPQ